MSVDPPKAPDATMVNRRWIPRHRREWAEQCDAIMRDYGMVESSTVYDSRHKARWRAQYLINLMVSLQMHPRWDLREHTERKDGGWIWTVEYLRRNDA